MESFKWSATNEFIWFVVLSSTESAVIEHLRATEAVFWCLVIPNTVPPLFSNVPKGKHYRRMVSRYGSSEEQVNRGKELFCVLRCFAIASPEYPKPKTNTFGRVSLLLVLE